MDSFSLSLNWLNCPQKKKQFIQRSAQRLCSKAQVRKSVQAGLDLQHLEAEGVTLFKPTLCPLRAEQLKPFRLPYISWYSKVVWDTPRHIFQLLIPEPRGCGQTGARWMWGVAGSWCCSSLIAVTSHSLTWHPAFHTVHCSLCNEGRAPTCLLTPQKATLRSSNLK